MSETPKTIGIDIGKNSFHVVGHNERGAIVLRQKWSRGHSRHSSKWMLSANNRHRRFDLI